jgi:hypothetical protein
MTLSTFSYFMLKFPRFGGQAGRMSTSHPCRRDPHAEGSQEWSEKGPFKQMDVSGGVCPHPQCQAAILEFYIVKQHLELCRDVDVLHSDAASVAHQLRANSIERDPRNHLPAVPKITMRRHLIRLLSLE